MAEISIADLIAALATGMTHAQRDAHLVAREYVPAYMADEVLRNFKVPNIEVDAVEVEIPVLAKKLVRTGAAATLSQTFGVVLISRKYQQAVRDRVGAVLKDDLAWSNEQVNRTLAASRTGSMLLLVTTDAHSKDRLARKLRDAGASVRIDKQMLSFTPADLFIDTDVQAQPAMHLRIKLIPRGLRLTRDASAPQVRFFVEPT